MTFINGFFLVNFLPFGIIVLLGLVLFFIGNYKNEKWYYPLFFIIIILAIISLWRIPTLIDRRYAMPTMVPGIIISTFLLINLPVLCRKVKLTYALAITRVIIIGLLIACAAKAMRLQEKKDYLSDISEIIKLDSKKGSVNGLVALLIFGNIGGDVELDNNVVPITLKNRHLNGKYADTEYQFHQLDYIAHPEVLEIQYPHIYMICSEPASSNFLAEWTIKYKNCPELIYEYINRKKVAYRLYRLKSIYATTRYSEKDWDKFLNEHNILNNGNFSKKYENTLSISPSVKLLKKNGVDLTVIENFYLPQWWDINPSAGWQKNCMPATIEIINRADNKYALMMRSSATISFFSNTMISGGQKYVLFVKGGTAINSIIHTLIFKYAEGKFTEYTPVFMIVTNNSDCFKIGIIDLTGFKGYARLAFYLSSGYGWLDNVSVIPMSVIDSTSQQKQK